MTNIKISDKKLRELAKQIALAIKAMEDNL
jgi:hypothetical protein